jgi:hypothetical protein
MDRTTPLRRMALITAMSVLTVGLAGCSSLSQIKTDLLRPSASPAPINTSFLEPSFQPSPYDPAAVVSEICVGKVTAPGGIQAAIDAKDGCAAMTDRPYADNPRALFQHVDAGGAPALKWQAGQLVRFTGGLNGVYKVVDDGWVAYGEKTNYPNLHTDILFQTCSWNADGGAGKMRVVGLTRVA